MKKIEILLKTIDKKKAQLLLSFSMVFSLIIHFHTKQKLENGYEFFLSFLSIFLNISCLILFMLVQNAQVEKKPKEPFRFFSSNFVEQRKSKDPFHLFKYVSYVFLLLLAIAPFIYLWSMRDVIIHLNWQKPFSR
ncbi:MAG: hypothetical protein ACEQR6_08180 [Burkholderiaceae bacterium]